MASERDDAELRWLDRLPFPVAYPLWYTHVSRLDTYSRLSNAVFAAQQAMRVAGLVLLADYLDCATPSRAVNEAVAGLHLPHWAEWTRLVTKLTAFWRGELPKERPERAPSFPSLVTGWRAVHGLEALEPSVRSLLEGVAGNEGPARSLNEAMWRRRNTLAHGSGTRTPEGGPRPEEVTRYAEIASTMARILFGDDAFEILRRVSNDRVLRLHGPHPDLRFTAEPSPEHLDSALLRTGIVIVRKEGAPLSLFPLFVPEGGDGYDESGGMIEPVTLIDEIRKQHVVLVGVVTTRIDTEHVRALNEALARKEGSLGLEAKQVAAWTIAAWARASTRETLAELEANGAEASAHVVRSGVDDRAAAYDAAGSALLLVGDSGSGRTSLVARLARGLIGDVEGAGSAPNDVVALLDAGAITSAGNLEGALCDALLEKFGIRAGSYSSASKLFADLHRTARQDTISQRRIWIFVDDLDAHPRFLELASHLREIVLGTRRYPWLRVVVTLRTGAQQLLFERETRTGSASFDLDGVWFECDDRPYVTLRPLTSTETARAAELWALGRGAPTPALEGLSAPLRELVADPWYLRLFLESTTAGDAAAPLTEDELLDRHLDGVTRQHPGARAAMTALATRFLSSGTCVLPLEEAEALTDRWRADETAANRDFRLALDPIELLVTSGVLLKPTLYGAIDGKRTSGYVFAHPRLCRRALVRALEAPLGRQSAPTADEVDAMLDLVTRGDGPIAQEIRDAIAAVGARLGRAASDDVFVRLLLSGARPLVDTFIANALVARAMKDAPAFDRLVALAEKLGQAASEKAETRRCWASALALATSIAAPLSLPVTELFAQLVVSTASDEEFGEAGAALQSSLSDLRKVASCVARAAADGSKFVDPRELSDTDVSASPPSQSLPKARADAQRLRVAKDLHYRGVRADGKGDHAEARRSYESVLAELSTLSSQTPGWVEAWARTAAKLAEHERTDGRPLVARELLLTSLGKLIDAAQTSKNPLVTAMVGVYVQLWRHARNLSLKAIYMGRVRALLKLASREGQQGVFTIAIDAFTRDKEIREPPVLAMVRCPRCSWQPNEDARWRCTCTHAWNTFQTSGICPRCEVVHETTSCLACDGRSPHLDWYPSAHAQRQP